MTLECAGNGRAQLLPRPVSQPWLTEAVGTASWSGTSLSSLLREAGVADGAVDVVFTARIMASSEGLSRITNARCPSPKQWESRSCWRIDERHAAAAAARSPAQADRSRLVWHGAREVATADHCRWRAVQSVPDAAYRLHDNPDNPGIPLTRIEPDPCSSRLESQTS